MTPQRTTLATLLFPAFPLHCRPNNRGPARVAETHLLVGQEKKEIGHDGGRLRGGPGFGADSMDHIRAIQVVIISANCWGSKKIGKKTRGDETHCIYISVNVAPHRLCTRRNDEPLDDGSSAIGQAHPFHVAPPRYIRILTKIVRFGLSAASHTNWAYNDANWKEAKRKPPLLQ